jgi:GNAT superfamily N-acetyltransferase
MSVFNKIVPDAGLAATARIAPVGLDDYSAVRYVHATAFRALASAHMTEKEIEAFVAYVRTPAYTDSFLGEELYGAWIEGELVATASWCSSDDNGTVARIGAVFVNPLYVRIGLGRRLVTKVEARAAQSGFERFTTRATVNAVQFFEHLGYTIASHGVSALTPECAVQVAFMRKSAPRLVKTLIRATSVR